MIFHSVHIEMDDFPDAVINEIVKMILGHKFFHKHYKVISFHCGRFECVFEGRFLILGGEKKEKINLKKIKIILFNLL